MYQIRMYHTCRCTTYSTAVSLFVYSLVGGGTHDTYVPPKKQLYRYLFRLFVSARTFRPWTHTSDDSYIYQLSLVVATATVSFCRCFSPLAFGFYPPCSSFSFFFNCLSYVLDYAFIIYFCVLCSLSADDRVAGDQTNYVGKTSAYYATSATNCCGCPEDVFVVLQFSCPSLSAVVVLCFRVLLFCFACHISGGARPI